MLTFRLAVDVPDDWMAVSQGRLYGETLLRLHDEDRVRTVWVEDNPTPELYLVAGSYYRHQDMVNGVMLATYTFEPSDSLARVYLEATGRYIAMYEGLIGEYPHYKFALVENFWQTGYGMPSFTLLGSKVIRLPFIVHTSYGHEILHNWWGNCVYVDYDSGNWCEGLTTYGADYLYKEQAGENQAREYRHHTLIDFSNYVTAGQDFPLTEFRERHNASTQSVGYGKSLMVFHMLRRSLGDRLFWEALRDFYRESRFRIVSWRDLARSFDRTTGQDLGWYFDQWTSRTGAPEVRLAGARYSEEGGRHALSFRLEQTDPPFTIDLPVVVETVSGRQETTVRLEDTSRDYRLEVPGRPLSMAVDPDYDTFRRLHPEEIPVTLGAMFGRKEVSAVIGNRVTGGDRRRLGAAARILGAQTVFQEGNMSPDDISGRSVWFLGDGDLVRSTLSGIPGAPVLDGDRVVIGDSGFDLDAGSFICGLRHPRDPGLSVGVVIGGNLESLESVAPRLPHYGRYSYLGFTGGRPVLKGVWAEEKSPLRIDFSPG
jgi:hypothetical protein